MAFGEHKSGDFNTEKREENDQSLFLLWKNLDFYQRLGVPENATQTEVKNAFRRISKIYHPDNQESGDHRVQQLITEAYDILKDPQKRAEYDMESKRSGTFVENNTSPKTPEEQVTIQALEEAKKGPNSFSVFVERLEKEGYMDAVNLIHNKIIVQHIVNSLLQHVERGDWHSLSEYIKYRDAWCEAGFERDMIEKDPRFLEIIYTKLALAVVHGPEMFREIFKQFSAQVPTLDQKKCKNNPRVISAVQAQIENAGEYFFRNFLARRRLKKEWRDIGVPF